MKPPVDPEIAKLRKALEKISRLAHIHQARQVALEALK